MLHIKWKRNAFDLISLFSCFNYWGLVLSYFTSFAPRRHNVIRSSNSTSSISHWAARFFPCNILMLASKIEKTVLQNGCHSLDPLLYRVSFPCIKCLSQYICLFFFFFATEWPFFQIYFSGLQWKSISNVYNFYKTQLQTHVCFCIEDDMLHVDWRSCQICYPLEIKLLLLFWRNLQPFDTYINGNS